MTGTNASRIEDAVLAGASLIYGVAAALLAYRFGATLAYCCSGGAVAFGCCILALRSIDAGCERLALPAFTAVDWPAEVPILELRPEDRLEAGPGSEDEELLLDDVLAAVGADARVVRLFDPAGMPTPGQIKTRIDAHLGTATRPVPGSDASQSLFDALNELRRSMR
jgi:hypothetical protein